MNPSSNITLSLRIPSLCTTYTVLPQWNQRCGVPVWCCRHTFCTLHVCGDCGPSHTIFLNTNSLILKYKLLNTDIHHTNNEPNGKKLNVIAQHMDARFWSEPFTVHPQLNKICTWVVESEEIGEETLWSSIVSNTIAVLFEILLQYCWQYYNTPCHAFLRGEPLKLEQQKYMNPNQTRATIQ